MGRGRSCLRRGAAGWSLGRQLRCARRWTVSMTDQVQKVSASGRSLDDTQVHIEEAGSPIHVAAADSRVAAGAEGSRRLLAAADDGGGVAKVRVEVAGGVS